MADTSGLKRAVQTRADFVVRRLQLDLQRDLVRSAKQHRQTGEMERAISVTRSRPSPTVHRITASVPVVQAATTDRGARPHIIRPRRARALRFVMDGRVVFAQLVHHPGNRPSRWFSRVFNQQHIATLAARFVGR